MNCYQQNKLKKSFGRGAAVEPIISQLKTDHRVSRNFCKGICGDIIKCDAFNSGF